MWSLLGSIWLLGSWQYLADASGPSASWWVPSSSCTNWLCYAKSRSVGHFKRLDVADVGCAATLKTQDFQLLFRFSYIINKLDGFVTAHKGWGSQRSICRIWFTDKVDCSFHVFQRYLIVSCHLWHLKNVFWSIISSISSIANRKIDFASSLLTEIINFISVP